MITGFRFKNYKLLHDVVLDDARDVSVLMGEHASGKGTVFDALCFLKDAHERGINIALAKRGGINAIRTWSDESMKDVCLGFDFMVGAKSYEYGIEFDENGISSEVLCCRGKSGDQEVLYERTEGGLIAGGGGEVRLSNFNAPMASVLGLFAGHDVLAHLRRLVMGIVEYRFDVTAMRRGMGSGITLLPDGSNLISVLRHINLCEPAKMSRVLNEARQFTDNEYLCDALEHCSHSMDVVRCASDGELRFLGYLIMLLYPSDDTSLICVRGPDEGFKLSAMRNVASLFGRSGIQTIVLLHSPRFALSMDQVFGTMTRTWYLKRGEHGADVR